MSFTKFIILICIFEMGFAMPIRNISSVTQMDAEEIIFALDGFKKSLRGVSNCNKDDLAQENSDREVDNLINSTQAPKQTDYYTYIEDFKKNSCTSSSTAISNELSLSKKCERDLSLVEELVLAISKMELDNKDAKIKITNENYRSIASAIKKAQKYKDWVLNFLRSTADDDDKREVYLKYIESVVVTMRDIFVVLRPYSSFAAHFKTNYFINVSTGLFEEFTDEYDKLQLGLNPSQDPYFIKLNISNNVIVQSFDEHSMIKRDIQTIAQYPMAKNYLYALRMMTIQMMASQIKTYDVLAGDNKRVIDMPRACTTNAYNGVWPAKLDLKVRDDISDGYLDAVLENHGLIYNNSNDLVLNYYIEDSKINPLKDAMFGAVEFNNYTNAKQAVSGNANYAPYFKATFDDVTAYPKFLEEKMPEARFQYSYKTQATRSSKATARQYKDIQLFDEIMGEESPYNFIEVNKGAEKIEIRPFTLNASKYLSHKMSELGFDNIADLIDLNTKKALQTTTLKIDFPSLYSPSTYRNWGINKIHTVIKSLKNEKESSSVYVKSLLKACAMTYNPFCANNKSKNLFEKLDTYLTELSVDGLILPIKKLEEKGVEKIYPLLFLLWNDLRDQHKLIPEAIISEYDYLLDQMNVINPIARLRLSYLLARQDLVSLKTGKKPEYSKTARGSRVTSAYQCHQNNLNGQIERLDKAAAVLLLNKPLKPNFLTSYLSPDDAKNMWKKVVADVDTNSSQLFTAKLNNKVIYDYIQNVSFKTTLDTEDVDKVISNVLAGKVSDETRDQLDETLSGQEVERISFFKELLNEKSHAKRLSLYEARAQEFGIQDDLSLKEQILAVDMNVKRLLYRDIMKKASNIRRDQTYKKLTELCGLNENDHDQLKEHFFATMKVQDNLNQMIGLQGAPKELMDQLYSMTDKELVNTGLAVGGFILGMAGVMLAGSCVVVTGGLCGIAVAGLVTAGMGAQTYVFKSEVDMKLRADQSVSHVDEMTELGYSSVDASENVSRSWAWAVIEGVSIIPLVGLFARGVNMGAKMTKESIKMIVLNSGKSNLSNVFKHSGKAARTIVDEADINLAKLVLGFTNYSDKFKAVFSGRNLDDAIEAIRHAELTPDQVVKFQNKISKIKKLQASGRISGPKLKELTKRIFTDIGELAIKNNDGIYKYTSNVVGDMTFKTVDEQLGKTIAKYFGGNPMELRGFMGTYIKKFLPRGAKASKAQAAKIGYEAAKEGKYLTGTNWIMQAWFENTYNLAKSEQSFLRIYDELLKLPKSEFEKYVTKHADELTDIFVKAPLRKRDLPYMFIQGGPHLGGLLNGRRLPGLQEIGEAVVVRKIFNARARLISESAKASAREILGENSVVAADTLSQVFKAFYATSREQAKTLGENGGKQLLQELATVRKVVLDEMFESLNTNPKFLKLLKDEGVNVFVDNKLNKNLLNKVLYESSDIKTEVYADMLWGLVRTEKLFKLKEFEFVAYKVMRETVSDQSISGVQKYLAMVKILLLKDKLGAVELF